MRDHDAASDPLAVEPRNFMDSIEPSYIDETSDELLTRLERDATIEAQLKMIVFMHAAFSFIHGATSSKETMIRLWAVSSALQHSSTTATPDTDIALRLGTTKANFCKHKLEFERSVDLPPSLGQKSIAARDAYRQRRKKQLNGVA